MNDQFDELAKDMAQSVTRRAALKKFGVGLAGIALAALGLTNKVSADHGKCLPRGASCKRAHSGANRCCSGICVGDGDSASKYGYCV
jgi:hypothetical protein